MKITKELVISLMSENQYKDYSQMILEEVNQRYFRKTFGMDDDDNPYILGVILTITTKTKKPRIEILFAKVNNNIVDLFTKTEWGEIAEERWNNYQRLLLREQRKEKLEKLNGNN